MTVLGELRNEVTSGAARKIPRMKYRNEDSLESRLIGEEMLTRGYVRYACEFVSVGPMCPIPLCVPAG